MKSYYGGPIGTHQCSFELYHPRPPTASSSPRLGVHNLHPKLQSLLSQERLTLQTSNLAGTFTGSIRTKVHQNFWKKGAWAYGTAQIFWILSQERVKLRTSNFVRTFLLSIGRKARYKFREEYSRVRSEDSGNFLGHPYSLLGASRGRLCDSSAVLLLQLTYYHSDNGGELLVDGKKPFRRYHIGPCSSYSSVMFGGMTVQMSAARWTTVRRSKSENYSPV